MSKQSADNVKRAWDKLVDHAVNGTKQRSFNVSLKIEVDGKTWNAYGAEVCCREIMFFCKEGIATFVVDSYGDRHTTELFNWEKSE